jgi:flagellar biosynthesis component FlhA
MMSMRIRVIFFAMLGVLILLITPLVLSVFLCLLLIASLGIYYEAFIDRRRNKRSNRV